VSVECVAPLLRRRTSTALGGEVGEPNAGPTVIVENSNGNRPALLSLSDSKSAQQPPNRANRARCKSKRWFCLAWTAPVVPDLPHPLWKCTTRFARPRHATCRRARRQASPCTLRTLTAAPSAVDVRRRCRGPRCGALTLANGCEAGRVAPGRSAARRRAPRGRPPPPPDVPRPPRGGRTRRPPGRGSGPRRPSNP
jgi:hypothetical protein